MSVDTRIRSKTLLLLCLALSAISLVELKITEINILGNKAEIDNPHMALLALWLIWSYFLWKHWQNHIISSVRLRYGYQHHLERILARHCLDRVCPIKKQAWRDQNLGDANLGDVKLHVGWLTANCDFFPNRKEFHGTAAGEKLVFDAIGFFHLQTDRVRAFLHVIVTRPEFTEIWFPYAFSTFTAAVGLIKLYSSAKGEQGE